MSDLAVLGQSFTLAGLSAVSGIDPATLEPRLRGLVRRELLALEADPRSPELGQYAFVQALIREVAYNTLARPDRKIRHLAAARYFESLETDELAGALAGHYLAAYTNVADGPESDALAVQARIALKAAAERAAALGSPDQAVVFLRQALTVTTDPAEEADLLERAGRSASEAGRHGDAETLLRRAIECQRARGDRPAVAGATAALGDILLSAYRSEPALAVLESAADELADLGDDPRFVALLGQLARGYMLHEDHERAVAVSDRVLGAAERLDLVPLVADTLVTKGTTLASNGRSYEGTGAIETGLRLAERHGLSSAAVRARVNLGAILSVGDPRAALGVTRDGLAEARRLGLHSQVMTFSLNAADAAIWVGDWDWALGALDEIRHLDLEPMDRVTWLSPSIRLRAARGEDVSALAEEMERLSTETTDPQTRSAAAIASADQLFALGDMLRAGEAYRMAALLTAEYAPMCQALAARAGLMSADASSAARGLAALEATGGHGPAIDARRASIEAGLAALAGRTTDALDLYAQSFGRFRDAGLAVDETFTAIEMATLLDPELPEVRAAAEAGRETLTGLRARPFLDRLEAAMARTSTAVTATPDHLAHQLRS